MVDPDKPDDIEKQTPEKKEVQPHEKALAVFKSLPQKIRDLPDLMAKATEQIELTIVDKEVRKKNIKKMSKVVFDGLKIVGFIDSADKIRAVWGKEGEKKRLGFRAKLAMTAVYAGHIVSSVAKLALTFGLVIIASPVIIIAASAMLFAKNFSEFLKENRHLKFVRKELATLEEELRKDSVQLERNYLLQQDLTESVNEIQTLEKQQQEILQNIEKLDALEKEDEEDNQKLQEISSFIEEDIKNKIIKNEVLSQARAEGNTDFFLQHCNEQLKLLAAAQRELSAQPTPSTDKEKKTQEDAQYFLDKSIKKYTILQEHFNKIAGLEKQLQDVKSHQTTLAEKYGKDPYQQRNDLKNIEQEYLKARVEFLQEKITRNKEVAGYAPKNVPLQAALGKINSAKKIQEKNDRFLQLKQTLKDNLSQEQSRVQAKIEDRKQVLENKKHFFALFVDPKDTAEKNIERIYQNCLAVVEKRQEVKLTQLARGKKLKLSLISGGALALAATLPFQGALPAAGVLVGVATGLTVVYYGATFLEWRKARAAQNKFKKEKGKQIEEILAHANKHAEGLGLKEKLDEAKAKLKEQLKENKPPKTVSTKNRSLHFSRLLRKGRKSKDKIPSPSLEVGPSKEPDGVSAKESSEVKHSKGNPSI